MTALAITSITNFILACVVFYLAGMLVQMPKMRFSAAWWWSGSLTLLGLGALIGGIDHGFFELPGLPRFAIQKVNWIVLGLMTFFLLMTTARQFFSAKVQRIFLAVGIIQFVVNTIFVFMLDEFLVVILNYAPVMLLLLVMNFTGLKKGAGSVNMIVGIVILFAAAAIQALGFDLFTPLDRNGVYHILSMVGVLFLYMGGRSLKTSL